MSRGPARGARRPRIDVTRYLAELRGSMVAWLPARGLPLIEAGRRWSDRLLATYAILLAWPRARRWPSASPPPATRWSRCTPRGCGRAGPTPASSRP